MADRCRCAEPDVRVVGDHAGGVRQVLCGGCGGDVEPALAAVATAEHFLETESASAHTERLESFAEALPEPPSWIESNEARRAWVAYQWSRADALGIGPPLVDLPQRDERRDRRRSWTWGQVLIAAWIVAFLIAFWGAVAAIAVEVLT